MTKIDEWRDTILVIFRDKFKDIPKADMEDVKEKVQLLTERKWELMESLVGALEGLSVFEFFKFEDFMRYLNLDVRLSE